MITPRSVATRSWVFPAQPDELFSQVYFEAVILISELVINCDKEN